MGIYYILWPFGILFLVLVCCTKKNLATLITHLVENSSNLVALNLSDIATLEQNSCTKHAGENKKIL
jgi:hypothetical protein